jgi:hypothetical protein
MNADQKKNQSRIYISKLVRNNNLHAALLIYLSLVFSSDPRSSA